MYIYHYTSSQLIIQQCKLTTILLSSQQQKYLNSLIYCFQVSYQHCIFLYFSKLMTQAYFFQVSDTSNLLLYFSQAADTNMKIYIPSAINLLTQKLIYSYQTPAINRNVVILPPSDPSFSQEQLSILRPTPQKSHFRQWRWKKTPSVLRRSIMYTRLLQKKQNSLAAWAAGNTGFPF